ncbi:MAG: hypothetical protein R3C60_02940 [Parvularculaceae bacterium]
MGKLPIFKAVAATFAYLARHGVELFMALWLPALLFTAANGWSSGQMFDAQIALHNLGDHPNPTEAMTAMGPVFKTMALMLALISILYPMMIVASLRHVVRGDRLKAPFYLGFGGDELRIIGAYLLIVLMALAAYFVLALGIGVLAAISSLAGPAGGVIGVVLGVAGFAVFFWFMVRLSLTFPASIATRTLGITQSWAATKGNSIRLVLYGVIMMVIFVMVFAALALPFFASIMPAYKELFAAGADPVASQAAQLKLLEAQRALYDWSRPGFWPFMAAMFAYTVVSMAFFSVASGVAWRYVSGDREA